MMLIPSTSLAAAFDAHEYVEMEHGPGEEICGLAVLFEFPNLRQTIRDLPGAASILFTDPILASIAEALVKGKGKEWQPDPGTDGWANYRRWSAIAELLETQETLRASDDPAQWTEEYGWHIVRLLAKRAGSPLIVETLRKAANAIERGGSLRYWFGIIVQTFNLTMGRFGPPTQENA